MSTWIEFLNLRKDACKKENPNLKWSEIQKLIGKEWKEFQARPIDDEKKSEDDKSTKKKKKSKDKKSEDNKSSDESYNNDEKKSEDNKSSDESYDNDEKTSNNYNNYILSKLDEYKLLKKSKILEELEIYKEYMNDDNIINFYDKCVSIHQKNIKGYGDYLENNILSTFLDRNNINYKTQVTIDNNGIIIGFNIKKNKCFHIVDFVIGNDIEKNKSITDYIVISCKTTCRERWTQDEWSLKYIPKLYILITISNDYPPSARFIENENRKIITCIPKNKDDRKYKLNFNDLIYELDYFSN